MFNYLIASAPKRRLRQSVPSALWSVVFHIAVVVAVVRLTTGSRTERRVVPMDTLLVFIQSEPTPPQAPPTPPLALNAPPAGFVALVAPVLVPTLVPPVDLRQTFDPRDFTGVGVELAVSGAARRAEPGPQAGALFAEATVQVKPEIIFSPPLHYPDLLRQAGIQGEVLVEVVIDTTGRAEPGSIRVVQSTNSGFNPEARKVVVNSVYRPGRNGGVPVRVLVQVPVGFSIRKRM